LHTRPYHRRSIPSSSSSADQEGEGEGESQGRKKKHYLTSKLITTIAGQQRQQQQHRIRTKSAIAIASGDAGGPGFSSNGNVLSAVLIPAKRSPEQGELISLAGLREWVFDAMKTSCNREEQAFSRLPVARDRDVLVYYHCSVDRAEELRIYLRSKPACSSGWKSIVITNASGKALGMAATRPKRSKDKLILPRHSLGSTKLFFVELWKTKLNGVHTKMATYGPFRVHDFIDGGLHFEWCEV
jgi:hypothetical protein